MTTFRISIVAMLFTFAIAACASTDSDLSAQLEEQAALIAELEEQIEELSAVNEEMEEDHGMTDASAFEVAVAQYIMDMAGFHAIDDALSETGEIEPAYISTVSRAARVISSMHWPDELSDAAAHLHEVLMDFEAALAEDDAQTAAPLAGMAHDQQHDLSAAISAWLSGEMPMDDSHEHEEDAMQDDESMAGEDHEHASEEDINAAHGVPEEAAAVSNPVPPDEDSIALGEEIYITNCASCHGDHGEGDGAAAEGFEKPPADFHAAHVQGLSDGGLFYIISTGIADSPMVAWDELLDEEDRWHLVNFMRTFKESSN